MRLSSLSSGSIPRCGRAAERPPRRLNGTRPDDFADDREDADEEDEDTPLPDNEAPPWWRDFGADFDDDEPEPEPGDFWPEIDDLCPATVVATALTFKTMPCIR